jgi:hypothetical protein
MFMTEKYEPAIDFGNIWMTVPTRPGKDQNLEIGRGRRRIMMVLMLGPHSRTERENRGDDEYGQLL